MGILTKVLDAMAVGTPVVMTDFVARLIPGIENGINAFVATTDEEFSKVVLKALLDPDARDTVAGGAKRLVEARYDWGMYTGDLEAIVRGEPASNWEG